MEAQVIPIGNENDTVATEEIKIGDNDTLGAHVASLVSADLLILLTQVEGLYTANPEQDPSAERMIRVNPHEDVMRFAGGSSADGWGRGGMITKVRAAQIAGSVGIPTLIAHGKYKITALLDDSSLGTYFEPSHDATERFLHAWPTSGAIKLSPTGWSSLMTGGDLELKGFEGVEGQFSRGAIVQLWFNGAVIGRGLTGYRSDQLIGVLRDKGADVVSLLGDDFDGAICRAEDWSKR
jgi:glutamate 5-kinase